MHKNWLNSYQFIFFIYNIQRSVDAFTVLSMGNISASFFFLMCFLKERPHGGVYLYVYVNMSEP